MNNCVNYSLYLRLRPSTYGFELFKIRAQHSNTLCETRMDVFRTTVEKYNIVDGIGLYYPPIPYFFLHQHY